MFYVEPNDPGLHTKGYIFRQNEEIYKIIIGSSNLTLHPCGESVSGICKE